MYHIDIEALIGFPIAVILWLTVMLTGHTGLISVWFPRKSKKRRAEAERLLAFSSESGGIQVVRDSVVTLRNLSSTVIQSLILIFHLKTSQLSHSPPPIHHLISTQLLHFLLKSSLRVVMQQQVGPAQRNYKFTIFWGNKQVWLYEYCSVVK